MNKAITDGLMLMPPAFSAGLGQWSSGDGTTGSTSYQGDPNAALVPADQDFGGCLELLKSQGTQKLRWTGQTPILPGCYLRVRAKVKAMSGNLPSVRIAAWAGGAGDAHVTGLVETGPATALTSYGQVVEVSAIVGTGARGGVDMVWPRTVIYGHFGLDLTGANGGIVRIDDIVIEDITEAYLREMLDWVDVRDYGARGDGVTDDLAAFLAADADAQGRVLVVPEGTYALFDSLSLTAPVRFEGRVSLPAAKRLILMKSFDLPSYVAAFGGDELEGFRRAFQALLNFSDHESLDMKGLRIDVTEPIDMQAAEGSMTVFEVRRVIRNGQFNVIDGPAWTPTVASSTASYSAASPTQLTNVANVANIAVGSLVGGTGVGREVYVTARNVGAGSLTLSQPLYGAAANQSYSFTRFRYVLDFSGFTKLSKMTIDDVEFQCGGYASGIMLAPAGEVFQIRDCYMSQPRDRGITSIGRGCQDLQIDRCHFNSSEMSLPATDRRSIAFNINANDSKIRDNRFQRFGHTGVIKGTGHMLVGNHWFQGDEVNGGPRVAGMIFTQTNTMSLITGNYIDNCFIEWTNEHDETPNFNAEYSFGGMSLTGNIFTSINAASWTGWLVVKPYGSGHFVHGISVIGNSFRPSGTNIDRVERVDTSFAALNPALARNITFQGNNFNGLNQATINPVTLKFTQATASKTWVLDVSAYLPFGGWARVVDSVIAEGAITNATGTEIYSAPYVTPAYGTNGNQVRLTWSEAVKGAVQVTVRTDNPV